MNTFQIRSNKYGSIDRFCLIRHALNVELQFHANWPENILALVSSRVLWREVCSIGSNGEASDVVLGEVWQHGSGDVDGVADTHGASRRPAQSADPYDE